MSCSRCKHLQYKEKKPGKISGAKYFCDKKKKYVNGADSECQIFEKSYTRTSNEINEIYSNGKKFYDDETNIITYVIILGVLIVLTIIFNIFK